MFAHEPEVTEVVETEKPQFEAGFSRSNDIIVNITRHINQSTVVLLIATIEEWVDKFYDSVPENTGCKILCLFNAFGEDFSCVTIFSSYMKSVIEKHPKVTFIGILEYAEGNAALMYMLMNERISKADVRAQSNTGIVRMGQSALLFNVVDTQNKNEIAKLLFENKIDKNVIKLCFPADDKSRVQYCGDVVQESGFSSTQDKAEDNNK